MEKQIKEIFTDDVVKEAAERYGADPTKLRSLGGFESFVYEYEADSQHYILRISHGSHRSADQIKGEMDWLNYLAENGVSVARAVPSKEGRFVESLQKDFSAVSFEKAKGQPPGKADLHEDLFRQMGEMTGKMHALTKNYQPSSPSIKRPEWYEDLEDFANKFLDPSEPVIMEKFKAIQKYPLQFPKGKDEYGLIHVDFHRGNFFVEDGHITLFDFDDCQYSWFAEDIAMSLFYAISPDCKDPEDLESARRFYDSFMEGYSLENALASRWLKEIPHFLKQREINVYLAVKGSGVSVNELGGWAGAFMKNRKDKIENDVPYVDLSF